VATTTARSLRLRGSVITYAPYISKICIYSAAWELHFSRRRFDCRPSQSRAICSRSTSACSAILDLVANHERSVSELAGLLGEPQPKVSNHLACLRWCGFVVTRREHRAVYYRLADERVAAVIALGRALLRDNEEHVAACRRVDES